MPDWIREAAEAIAAKGGRAYYVGGCVRDPFLGKTPKDHDVEVYGLPVDSLVHLLKRFGKVSLVGKSFGIIKVRGADFSLPRRERKTAGANAHTAFDVTVDPYMSITDATRRRDFTMNALLQDVLTGELSDPFGGLEDIKRGVIRHIADSTFVEDQLRVYRAAQFAARFGFRIAPETLALCRAVDLSGLLPSRIYVEWQKLLLMSARPSVGLEALRQMGVIETYYPILHAITVCEQTPEWHPEGNVWNHTMLVLDEAAKRRDESEDPEAFMWAALLHDVGKPATAERLSTGRITTYGHDEAGAPLAEEFMLKLTSERRLIEAVPKLVRYHMQPHFWANDVSAVTDTQLRRLANKAPLKELVYLAEADHHGRGLPWRSYSHLREFVFPKLETLHLNVKKIEPLVKGRDLLPLGFPPGPAMGQMLKRAYEMQLDGLTKEAILAALLDGDGSESVAG